MDFHVLRKFDQATSHNLRRLVHFSKQTGTINPGQLADFVNAVLNTHDLLPQTIQKKIHVHRCLTSGSHERMNQERRDRLLHNVCADLSSGLKAVAADESLHRLYVAGVDRPKTLGEKILALCDEYETAHDKFPVLAQLVYLGAGTTVAVDANALQLLLQKKRVPNADLHDTEIRRRKAHIRTVARDLHHRLD